MNALTASLGLKFPLLQAGMGGVAGSRLAAAVANAGAGGILGLYRMPPGPIRDVLRDTEARTASPFGVNLIPELVDDAHFGQQVKTVLAATDARVFFTCFGLPPVSAADAIRAAGRALIVMVGTTPDAVRAEAIGASAVVLQGTEAGGHLLGASPLETLAREVSAAGLGIPFLCAGGIGHGSDFGAFDRLGASGCLCGTLFVATEESDAHPRYKERLITASADDTVVTHLFEIGWPRRRHRVLRNGLTDRTDPPLPPRFIARVTVAGVPHPVPRYGAMVPTVHTQGSIDDMALYAGTSAARIRDILPARERVERFMAEFSLAGAADVPRCIPTVELPS
ncbi:MAG: nitronate monooxygenase family protein [Burkholderiales bacterium]